MSVRSCMAFLFCAVAVAPRVALSAQVQKPAADSASLYHQAERLSAQADSLRSGGAADRQRAIALLAQAAPLYTSARARGDVMYAWFSTGQIYRELNRADSALGYFRRALTIAREISFKPGELSILQNMGLDFTDLGRPDSAMACFRMGLRLAAAEADTAAARSMVSGIGRSYLELGHPDSAIRYFRMSLPGSLTVENRGDVASALDNIGGAWSAMGQLDSALVFYNDALALRRDMKDSGLEGRSLHNIAGVFARIGATDSALFYYFQALPLEQRAGDREGEGTTLQNIGDMYSALDRYDSALVYLQRAVRIKAGLGNPAQFGVTFQEIAAVFSDLGQIDSSRAMYRDALKIAQDAGDRESIASIEDNLGLTFFDQGQGDSAMAHHRAALAIERAIKNREGESRTLSRIGSVFRATGHPDSALAYYEAAAALSATLSEQSGGEFNQLHYNEQTSDTYALWAMTWLDRANAGEGAPATFAALAASERGRAQALLRLMGTKREYRPGADLAAEGKELAQRALTSAAGALVYHVAGDTLIAWLALKDGSVFTSEQTVPEGRLDTLVAALRYSIAQEDAAVERNARITRGGSGQLDAMMLPATVRTQVMADTGKAIQRELSQLLLPASLASHLPAGGELIVIPHGGLGLVPFGLLRAGSDTARLGDRFALRYGPSLTAMAEAEARPALAAGDRAKQLAPALIVGDPVMPAPFKLDNERYVFDPLPGARVEGKAVADSLGASQWLSGGAASEAAVRAAIPAARLIHLATHGLVYSSDAHARLSFVALAPDATHDGHLSVAKIVDSLTFKAELVVLSACQTAVGNVKSAEGTLGLQRAVLAKGARSVLVSLWNVNDESTLFLIQRFYHHWLHDGNVSKAEALRLAQADVRAESRVTPAHKNWADPMYWAAFQLVGAP